MNQEQFYEKIPEWIQKDRESWNHITLMAYFCHKYRGKHGVNFRLVRWNGDPGKGKESRDFARLIKILAPENFSDMSAEERSKTKAAVVSKIYNYINWMFDYKFRRGERSVTGTGLFLMPSMINEFERMYSKHLSLKQQSRGIQALLSWAEANIPDVLSRHQIEEASDLRMVETYVSTYGLKGDSCEAALLRKAKEMEVL